MKKGLAQKESALHKLFSVKEVGGKRKRAGL